jgi:predicted Zn-dependent peptidase
VVDLLPANDPQLEMFGPPTFRLANGTSQNNPLRTRMRFTGTNRGDSQVKAPDVKTLGVQFNKVFRFGRQGVEIGGSIFNLLNSGDYTQYNYSGANEQFNPNFLLMRNQQAARAFQATLVYRF